MVMRMTATPMVFPSFTVHMCFCPSLHAAAIMFANLPETSQGLLVCWEPLEFLCVLFALFCTILFVTVIAQEPLGFVGSVRDQKGMVARALLHAADQPHALHEVHILATHGEYAFVVASQLLEDFEACAHAAAGSMVCVRPLVRNRRGLKVEVGA